MNYPESLNYLYARLPMFQRIGAAALKPSLANTIKLLAAANNPHERLTTIHIAGTNGKGTSAHSLCAILMEAGYRVGLYTSPHLKSFTERIKVNGNEIEPQFVADFVTAYQPVIEELSPSFFEATFVMCMAYFEREQVDVAVIEVGLGGRLDSTNVITPIVSLITMIGWDHADLLGDTLEKIATEKAGIIKVKVPVVIGADQPDLLHVFQNRAEVVNAPLYTASDIAVKEHARNGTHVALDCVVGGNLLQITTDITAKYFQKNIPGILKTVEILREMGFTITFDHLKAGLSNVKRLTGLKGRWQLLSEKPTLIADISHNEPGLRELFGQVALLPHEHLHLIVGFVRDKDLSKVLGLLPLENTSYYFTQSSVPRSLPASELMESAAKLGLQGVAFSDVNAAIASAKNQSKPDDLILVCGSTFVVAEIDGL